MNDNLKHLVDNHQLGFEDLFEALAAMCVENTRDITEDILLDIGPKEYIETAGDLSVENLTEISVDWAQITVAEMLADEIPTEFEKKDNETFMDFVIRYYIVKHVKDNKSFKIKLS